MVNNGTQVKQPKNHKSGLFIAENFVGGGHFGFRLMISHVLMAQRSNAQF